MGIQFIYFIILGYVLGSLSPGYFFGRVVKKIDIRDFGNRNTGANNTFRIVGPVYGIIAGVFDFLKAPLAYYFGLFYINADLAILVGLAAVLGHIFPFYLEFRGGKGVASLSGLFLLSLFYSSPAYSLFLVLGMLVYYMGFLKPVKISARHWLKLGSIIFPLGLIWLGQGSVAWALGGLLWLFLVFDLSRFRSARLNKKYLHEQEFAKGKEGARFSGYTMYSLSSLAVILLFPEEIAVFVLIAFPISDVLAQFSARVSFLPQIRLIGGKTWTGFGVVLLLSFFSGWFLNALTPITIPFWMMSWGALFVAVLDQLAFRVDDNLLVPLGTATALWALMSFF